MSALPPRPPGAPHVRVEHDAMGAVEVPAQALYGAQTQRAVQNFPLSGRRLPVAFIRALLMIKGAAAAANGGLEVLPAALAAAIEDACDEALSQPDEALMAQFPVDVFQTGSGTSTHMNANEVVATLAARRAGHAVHPNDHVNAGQSSNDVVPSALRLAAALALQQRLLPALAHLRHTVLAKAPQLHEEIKTGRTHLMDALPVRFSQVLEAWAFQLRSAERHVRQLLPALQSLPLGGTAVGTGVNAHPAMAAEACRLLTRRTGLVLQPSPRPMALMSAQDDLVAASGALKVLAVTLMKIANDLRWMNSGPIAGLGEIELEALQPGSSIMPGKVNPVVPEAVAMVAAQVMGHDATLTIAGQSGSFELNTMMPLMAATLLDSIGLLACAMPLLADQAIAGFRVNSEQLRRTLAHQPMLATALSPLIGYARATAIAQQAWAEGRTVLDVAMAVTDLPESLLRELLDPAHLAGDA